MSSKKIIKFTKENVQILFIYPLIKINLSQLITMLNGSKENEYRHRPEYTEFVVLYNMRQTQPVWRTKSYNA